jgi:hypothetical protein
MNMKRTLVIMLAFLASGLYSFAASLGTAARTVIPVEVQQVINVDYRRMRNSETAMDMKAKLLPPNMKQFEDALKDIGVNPDKDIDQITLASFRLKDHGLQMIGIAQGQFPRKKLGLKIAKQNIKGTKKNGSIIYPMSGGMEMSFLDETTLLFGEGQALRGAIDARDGYVPTLDSNPDIANLIGDVESGTVWSILDQKGTQNMLISAMGDASRLADYETVKKRILGSRYTMNFSNGVNFDLDVITTDTVTAATLSSLVKAGVLYRKMTASSVEKAALEDVTVNSDSSKLQMHFKADDRQFQSLIHTSLFAAVSR